MGDEATWVLQERALPVAAVARPITPAPPPPPLTRPMSTSSSRLLRSTSSCEGLSVRCLKMASS